MANNPNGYILGLDVGDARIGVAIASSQARLASPLKTLSNAPGVFKELQAIIEQENVISLVMGLPRSQDGQESPQSQKSRQFARQLADNLQLPVYLRDESATSLQAEAELSAKGKPYTKGDIDAQAAAIILQDYLNEQDHQKPSF